MTDEEQDRPGGAGDAGGVGSVGEEAARLFGAISDWAREHGHEEAPGAGPAPTEGPGEPLAESLAGLAGQAADTMRDLGAHIATDDPECRWCPVCRSIHLVRQCTPEVRDQLGVAAAHLMQAAAGLLVAASSPERRDRPGEGVQRIDLDDGPDPAGPDPAGPDPGGAP